MSRRYRWPTKNHGSCGESSGCAVIKSTVCAAMMSLASQTLTASGEDGTSGTIAVLLATDFATVLATLLCRAPAMERSILALRTRCRNAVRAARVRERRRSISIGAHRTHGLHAA